MIIFEIKFLEDLYIDIILTIKYYIKNVYTEIKLNVKEIDQTFLEGANVIKKKHYLSNKLRVELGYNFFFKVKQKV